jgi:putative ABC transport system ATP-binding protein
MKKNEVIIQVKDLVKTYHNGEIETKVLKKLNLDIIKGEFVAIMGKSGAGKSTFMYQISLLDKPTSGEIIFDGVDILKLSEFERTQFRLNKLGYVFQDYALIPELSAEENITLPMIMQGIDEEVAKEKAHKILNEIGMVDKYTNRPNQLSGGEQQRVSIARAVAHEPAVLFADEPTANLDTVSSQAVLDLLKQFHQQGQTIVMVTHEPEYTAYCDRVIYLKDGHIIDYDYKIDHK